MFGYFFYIATGKLGDIQMLFIQVGHKYIKNTFERVLLSLSAKLNVLFAKMQLDSSKT